MNLLSGNPSPSDGVSAVTASTVDKEENEVSTRSPVLWTGAPIITLTQTSSTNSPFVRTYDYTVTDGNGNPMSEGTNISVTATGTKIVTSGNVGTKLGDTGFIYDGDLIWDYNDVIRGPGITEFSFAITEDPQGDAEDNPSLQQLTIGVSGPNGDLEITWGASGASTKTAGATIEERGNTIIVSLDG